MSCLIFGSTGMLGRALTQSWGSRIALITPSRHECNLENFNEISACIQKYRPKIVLNTAGLISIELCEQNPELSWQLNAAAVKHMADACSDIKARFIQISTDHYYLDGHIHDEEASICLVNQYAKSKYAGEIYAKLVPNHVIIRTNITGFRHSNIPTFVEWAIQNIVRNVSMTLFDDFYSSTLDTYSFAQILWDLANHDVTGVYNLASSSVASKAEFITLLSKKLGVPLCNPSYQSVKAASQLTNRATALGLDVKKIEKTLGYSMPTCQDVVTSLVEVYKNERN